MNTTYKDKREYFAHIISRSFDIYFVFPIIFLICFFNSLSVGVYAFAWLVLFLLMLVVVPVLADLYLVEKKKISDWDVSKRNQRASYITDISLLLLVLVVLSFLFTAPTAFLATAIILFLIESIFSIITYFWKVSIHAELVMLFFLYSFLLVSRGLFFFAIAIPLMFFARMYLKMHTFMQLFLGSGVSLVVCAVVLKLFRLY